MGQGSSVAKAKLKSDAEVISVLMPIYFTSDPVSKADVDAAQKSWNLILEDKCQGLCDMKDRGELPDPSYSGVSMFHDAFYSRLFDVHPMCRPMFTNAAQGRFFVKMISLSLSLLDDEKSFQKTLTKLTETHNERGIKAVEYGVVGEVILWSLRYCLGDDYTPEIHLCWLRILCRMLKVMIPVAVKFEMENGRAQEARMLEYKKARAASAKAAK